MFKLEGIIEEGTTAIGVHTHEGHKRLVAVTLAKGLSDQKARELADTIRLGMLEPDIPLSENSKGTLAANFARSTADTLTIPVHNPEGAEPVLEAVLPLEGYHKFLFMCDDEESYLHLCANLGMSREDFMKFGKMKVILESGNEQKSGVLGSVHNLIDAIKRGDEMFPYLQDQKAPHPEQLISSLASSDKFFIPETDLPLDPEIRGALPNFIKGDYSLPFPNCLLEFEYTGRDARSGRVVKSRTLMHAFEGFGEGPDKKEYYGTLFDRIDKEHFRALGFGPKWRMTEDGRLDYLGPFVVSPNVRAAWDGVAHDALGRSYIDNRSAMALKRLGPLLTRYNDPRSTIITHTPPEKMQLQREKRGRMPFFEHHVVAPRQPRYHLEEKREGEGTRPPMPLRAVRRHFKPTQGIWVEAYLQGDPKHGVDVASFSKLKEGPDGMG